MTQLDRGFFSRTVQLNALRVTPKLIGTIQKQHRFALLTDAAVKPILNSGDQKLMLLRPELDTLLVSRLEESYDAKVVPYTLQLDYDHWTADEILGAILPLKLSVDIPTAYSLVGHIAHMNIPDAYKPYRHLIGQVVLDKNSSVGMVVNKLDTIDNTFRTFEMEILASRMDKATFQVEQRESDCRFQFDFSKVYWNSRLSTEHFRLVQKYFNRGEAVADVFAGVGPFALPAAKQGVLVLANDLNPESYTSLASNATLNHVSDWVRCFNLDGADFIRHSRTMLQQVKGTLVFPPRNPNSSRKRQKKLEQTLVPIPQTVSHYVMNLPASAMTFLSAFRGLYRDVQDVNLPMIHVYAFSPESEAETELPLRAKKSLGSPIEDYQIWLVRNVAPNKVL